MTDQTSLPSIFVVDDDPSMTRSLAKMLVGFADVRCATNGAEALRQMRAAPPDLVLMKAEMPAVDGVDLCASIKSKPALADIPVIFVTEPDAEEFERADLEAGAADFISKPVSRKVLLARVRTQLRITELTDKVRRQSPVDSLTEVANRWFFADEFAADWRRARQGGLPIAVVLFDVDHLHRYNTHYGHVAGDACLRDVALTLRSIASRPSDLVARVGGEKFALLLPETSAQEAARLARQAVEAVESLCIEHVGSPSAPYLTVSAGIGFTEAAPPSREAQPEDGLLQAATDALYAAKNAGRNQVFALGLDSPVAPSLARVTEDLDAELEA